MHKSHTLPGIKINDDEPIVDQIRAALQKNAARVIDLFREWDEARPPLCCTRLSAVCTTLPCTS